MTKTKWLIIIVGLLLITVLCLAGGLLSVQMFSKGCLWWNCPPDDILHLSLPSELFPANATYRRIHPTDDDDPETLQSSIQTIYLDNGTAIYTVDMLASNKNASLYFENIKNSFFSDRETDRLWGKPDELTYISPIADDFFIACGTLRKDDNRCGLVAQYQEFVLFFNATISNGMSYQDFQKIVIYIDEQMSNYLAKK